MVFPSIVNAKRSADRVEANLPTALHGRIDSLVILAARSRNNSANRNDERWKIRSTTNGMMDALKLRVRKIRTGREVVCFK
jgi:hypothetical protein